MENFTNSFQKGVFFRLWGRSKITWTKLGGPKLPIFVHVPGKNVHVEVGRWSKKGKIMATYLLNDPFARIKWWYVHNNYRLRYVTKCDFWPFSECTIYHSFHWWKIDNKSKNQKSGFYTRKEKLNTHYIYLKIMFLIFFQVRLIDYWVRRKINGTI